MANYYTWGSAHLPLTEEQKEKAREIIARLEEEYEADDEVMDANHEIDENGIWFVHDESISPSHVCHVVEVLQKELELDGPFHMEFSYTCGKPRLDAFGGCGFVCERNKPTVWAGTELIYDTAFVAREREEAPPAPEPDSEIKNALTLFAAAYKRWNDLEEGGEDGLHYAAKVASQVLEKGGL